MLTKWQFDQDRFGGITWWSYTCPVLCTHTELEPAIQRQVSHNIAGLPDGRSVDPHPLVLADLALLDEVSRDPASAMICGRCPPEINRLVCCVVDLRCPRWSGNPDGQGDRRRWLAFTGLVDGNDVELAFRIILDVGDGVLEVQ